jgi:hypothetical protein
MTVTKETDHLYRNCILATDEHSLDSTVAYRAEVGWYILITTAANFVTTERFDGGNLGISRASHSWTRVKRTLPAPRK